MVELVRTLRECNAVFGLIRSGLLKRTRLIGDYIGSDICLLVELSLAGRLVELPEQLFFRREHAASSSCDKSVGAQQAFFNPHSAGRVVMPDTRKHLECVRAVMRAAIPLAEKTRLLGFMARLMAQCRRGTVQEVISAARAIVGV